MATPVDNDFLIQATTYLGATAICVPLFRKLKLGTILGFLFAGILLGEYGLGLLHREEGVFHVAELGVVLFLFIIGLELSLSRLWNLRKSIFGMGAMQMAVSGALLGACFIFSDVLGVGPALIAGFALACSSTAFALSLLEERGEMNTRHGRNAFSILLFQDIAVIPLLAFIPFVAAQNGDAMASFSLNKLLLTFGVIAGLVIVARYVFDRVFRIVAVSGSREAFTATTLFIVAATALAVSSVGLSMALGAFIAGVLLAESSFRHQIEADIEPFRELLLGLFFIGVGMQLDLSIVYAQWLWVVGGAVLLVAIKIAVTFTILRVAKSSVSDALRSAVYLSQGGEFAFVVLSVGVSQAIFPTELASIISAIVTLSMMTTPALVMALSLIKKNDPVSMEGIEEIDKVTGRALIIGYGRMGQIIGQILNGAGVSITAIDNDPRNIERAARFGAKVYFGDASNIRLLLTAGAGSADLVILCIKDRIVMAKAVAELKAHSPNLRIMARAYDRIHEIDLLDHDLDFVVRETFESSIAMAEAGLDRLGFGDNSVKAMITEFRQRDKDRILLQKVGGPEAGKEKIVQPFEAADYSQDS